MSEQRKAILGGVLAALSVLAGALTGDAAWSALTPGVILASAAAGLTSYLGVYTVRNGDAPDFHEDDEPIEVVRDAFQGGPFGVTAKPPPTSSHRDPPEVG